MKRLYRYIHAYHPIVHFLMIGTIFISLTSSMSIPFLAIYLGKTTTLSYSSIGLIIGAGALAGMFGGFIGGMLSDFLGRKILMVISIITLILVFIGFVYTQHPVMILVLSILRGLAASFFATISKALMGDLTPAEKRFRVFSNRYLAGNIGYSIGPIVGAYLGIGGGATTFLLTACVYLIYLLILLYMFGRFSLQLEGDNPGERLQLPQVLHVLRKDKVLFLFIIGSILLTTVHGEMSVTLSQYLSDNFEEGVRLFGLLMSINGLTVIFLQVMMTRWSERYNLFVRIALGSCLFAVGELGFAFSTEWFGFILSMFIFTVGEILIIPAEYAQIDQITPHGMRGTYYGTQSFSELGNFLGPWVGGVILAQFGGPVLFISMAFLSLSSLFFYAKGNQLYKGRTNELTIAG